MKLIIDIDEEDYNFLKNSHIEYDLRLISKQSEKDIQGTLAILRTIDNVKNSKSLQAELEEIKAEIDSIRDVEVTDGIVYVNEDNVFDILDNHISELKGENNELSNQ